MKSQFRDKFGFLRSLTMTYVFKVWQAFLSEGVNVQPYCLYMFLVETNKIIPVNKLP